MSDPLGDMHSVPTQDTKVNDIFLAQRLQVEADAKARQQQLARLRHLDESHDIRLGDLRSDIQTGVLTYGLIGFVTGGILGFIFGGRR